MKLARVLGALTAVAVAGAAACSVPITGVETDQAVEAQTAPEESFDSKIDQHAAALLADGREIFRHGTFGSEAFWATSCICTGRSPARGSAASAPVSPPVRRCSSA